MTPNEGLGVLGAPSWRVNHQTLVSPNKGQPTSFQKTSALSTEGTASPEVLPLTGQPVSVIQTGLPPATPLVFARAAWKRPWPWLRALGLVFS